jgi:hypothetical protein
VNLLKVRILYATHPPITAYNWHKQEKRQFLGVIMRERVLGMMVMWLAIAVSIGILVSSIRYTEYITTPVEEAINGAATTLYQTTQQVVLMPGSWQLAVAVLIFFLVMAGMGGTITMWESVKYHQAEQKSETAVRRESAKMKRDRQARVRRLLENLDDDDLAALESGQLGDDGERLSLQELMRR